MGMYTEFFVTARIKNDAEAVAALSLLTVGGDACWGGQINWPDHPFFKCERFRSIFNSTSYYFTPISVCEFRFDEIGGYWSLVSYSSLKNYDSEIEHFIDWLRPYLDDDDEEGVMIGYSRYEEHDDPVIYRK